MWVLVGLFVLNGASYYGALDEFPSKEECDLARIMVDLDEVGFPPGAEERELKCISAEHSDHEDNGKHI